jgi:hypothetical protein
MESALSVLLTLITSSEACKKDFLCIDSGSNFKVKEEVSAETKASNSGELQAHPLLGNPRFLLPTKLELGDLGSIRRQHPLSRTSSLCASPVYFSHLFSYLVINFNAMLPYPNVVAGALEIFYAVAWDAPESQLERYAFPRMGLQHRFEQLLTSGAMDALLKYKESNQVKELALDLFRVLLKSMMLIFVFDCFR